jgi:cytochrome d ubiquinol oxidase subunit II
MDLLAFGLLIFFTTGYFLLAGLDIGVGMLLPVLGRDEPARRLTIAAIAPFFLGNEVWLVTSAGLLAGLLPHTEHVLLGVAYPVVVALLAGWIIRDMGLWLRGRGHARGWRRLCDGAITGGSWAVATCWGVAAGTVLSGLRIGAFALAFGAVTAALTATHGALFAAVRLRGDLRARALRLAARAVPAAIAAIVGCAAVGTATGDLPARPVQALAALAIPAFAAAAAGLSLRGVAGRRVGSALAASALAMCAPVLAASALPVGEAGTAAPGVAAVAAVLVPLLVVAQGWVWWTFRHPVDRASYL